MINLLLLFTYSFPYGLLQDTEYTSSLCCIAGTYYSFATSFLALNNTMQVAYLQHHNCLRRCLRKSSCIFTSLLLPQIKYLKKGTRMHNAISVSTINTADMLRTHLKKGNLDIDPNANVPTYLIWVIFLIYQEITDFSELQVYLEC